MYEAAALSYHLTYLPATKTIGDLALSSLSGAHLHFEVKIIERKNIPAGHAQGEQNPHNWLYLPFGKKKITGRLKS